VLDLEQIKPGKHVELRDDESKDWLPLTIMTVSGKNVECRMTTGEAIFATIDDLLVNARLRPYDGSCADCGDDAHAGPCIERRCSDCGSDVSSRCSQHPLAPVHVYRRIRYLAEVVAEKPYPTQETAAALRRDLVTMMHTLRNAEQPRQSRVMITVADRADILSAIENAVQLIESLPSGKGHA
jgi:hypothetical protein